MAKKKSDKSMKESGLSLFSEFSNQLSEIMNKNHISQEMLYDIFTQASGTDIRDMLNENCYTYQRPDYFTKVKPLHPVLGKIMKIDSAKGLEQICDEAIEALKKESPEKAREELVNALYWILANQGRFIGEKDPELRCNLPLFCIFQIMIALEVKDVTDVIIELLRQDAYFYEYFFGAFEEEASLAISKLCIDGMDKLEEYMYETGRMPMTKCITADGVVQIGLDNPMIKLKVVTWFARVFARYCDIVVYPANIDHIVLSVTQLNAKELNPVIERLYTLKDDIPFIEIKDKKTLRKLLDKGNPERRIEYSSLLQLFDELSNMKEDEDDDIISKDDWMKMFTDNIYDEDEDDVDDEYYYDEDEDDDSMLVEKCYDGSYFRLHISLDNSPVEVTRTLVVPSNIRLSMLSHVLVRAMGWDGSHLAQFIKGKAHYCSAEVIAESWGNIEEHDYNKVALNELLKRKGSKMAWEYDFGDSWRHTVELAERIKTKKPMKIEVTDAVGACPPDDCGGVWGYDRMLEILKDKKHPDYEETIEWLGPRFNPTKVSIKTLNNKLKYFNN